MAEQDIVERLRQMASIKTSALYSQRKTLTEAADLIATLRQQLAEARETAANVPNGTADAIAREEEAFASWGGPDPRGSHVRVQRLAVVRALRASADAIRALPHTDREGERLSETETAARIVDTQAQYYAGHNQTIAKAIAKALREAAGAIRAQSQPRPGREGERE